MADNDTEQWEGQNNNTNQPIIQVVIPPEVLQAVAKTEQAPPAAAPAPAPVAAEPPPAPPAPPAPEPPVAELQAENARLKEWSRFSLTVWWLIILIVVAILIYRVWTWSSRSVNSGIFDTSTPVNTIPATTNTPFSSQSDWPSSNANTQPLPFNDTP